MPDDVARSFAECDRGLVVAPAGCGKTHLIAESVSHAAGKQLVLTHTHAGVDALRSRLNRLNVPPAKYRVTTIDSLALSYSMAFPHLAGWERHYPGGDGDWHALRVAASRLFSHDAPRRVLQASYTGVFVDEYQDCCGTQHAMVAAIAEALPCRIVGDPLQAIYRKLHPEDIVAWSEVERLFPIVDVLSQPYRWLRSNPPLGDWLAHVRSQLNKGAEIDLGIASKIIEWKPSAEPRSQIAACYKMIRATSVAAISDWPARCAAVAGNTKSRFTALESVECPDLLDAAEAIEKTNGPRRVASVVTFAQKCLTGMTPLTDLLARIRQRNAYSPRSPDRARLWTAMQKVAASSDLREVGEMLAAIAALSDSHHFKRRELWEDMTRLMRIHAYDSGRSLRDAAWSLRDQARRHGRRLPPRIVATPLLVKGLEFDHAMLLDAVQMKSAEELYVALTRGSRSLTVLSAVRKVATPVPAWVAEAPNATEG